MAADGLEWIERMRRVAADLAAALAESLGLARDYFDDAFNLDPHLLLKRTRYPEDRGGSGLQFFDGDAFIGVVPRCGAFVINLGEALELAASVQYCTAW
ncbi:MAG TPA: hypothetical protein VME66_15545 [Candidatus Acidoferrales bacterium]|nr:hypothetical protein [Candidatus Acidoferrales bacterium]